MKFLENLDKKCAIFFDYICLFVLVFVVFESFFDFEFVNYHLLIIAVIALVLYLVITTYLFHHYLTPGEMIFDVRTREKQYHRFMNKVESSSPLYRLRNYRTSAKARVALMIMLTLLLVVLTGVFFLLKWIF